MFLIQVKIRMKNPDDKEIAHILRTARNIAVVGASNNPYRDSYSIMNFLLKHGYNVIPVNPKYNSIMGQKCYPRLLDVNEPVDIVDIFRRPEDVPAVIEDAITIKAKTVWMQLGAYNELAAKRAGEAGLNVISNRCIKVEYVSLLGTG